MAKVRDTVLSSALHGVVHYLKPTYLMGNLIMSEITIIDHTASFSISAKRPEKTGSIARLIGSGDKTSRQTFAQTVYLKQYSCGQFRPLARDIVDVLVAKSAQPYVIGLIPTDKQMNKQDLISLCSAVASAVRISGKELKGEKAWLFGLVERIIESNTVVTVEA